MPFRITVLATLIAVPNALSGYAADLDAGRKLARQCSVCHGKNGIASDPEMPNLAGQSAFYLEKAIKDFRSGARQDRRMSLIAKDLSDDEIRNLAAWYGAFSVAVESPD